MRTTLHLTVLLLALAGAFVAPGCGPPAQLHATPSAFNHTERLGAGEAPSPLASTKVDLRSSEPSDALTWGVAQTPTWIKLSADHGSTPSELEVSFDLASMAYGENSATLVFRQKETELPVPVRYELLGALKIGPGQTVPLGGIAGEPRSSVARFTVDSPLKPGLKWRAKSDDAWLVLEPTSGETPATVSVYADLAKAGPDASGRIEFSADAAWKGSPTAVPVVLHTLAMAPASLDQVAHLGGGSERPATTRRVELRSSAAEESLGWTLSGAPPWLHLSATQGGTPTDLDLQFDLAAMSYGENVTTLTLRHRDAERAVRVRYEVLGALRIGPTQSVSLRGVAGAETSSVVNLTLDSPEKPGLRWTAKSDDPWLVIEPTSGTTPATVAVHAVLAKAAPNSSGRIEFRAESTWQGSPTVIPVVVEILNPDAVRKQIDAKLQLITAESDETGKAVAHIAEGLRSANGIDAVVNSFRDIASRTATASKRMATLEQDLLGFLEQNSAYDKTIGFSEIRATAARLVKDASNSASRLQACVDGIRTVTFDVNSHAEWQTSSLHVDAGDLIAFEASGTWTLGPLAGRAGPEGINVADYRQYSIDPAYFHGCLLLRVGEGLVAAGTKDGFTKVARTGTIEGRCNDKNYTDNKGAIAVRIAVIPSL